MQIISPARNDNTNIIFIVLFIIQVVLNFFKKSLIRFLIKDIVFFIRIITWWPVDIFLCFGFKTTVNLFWFDKYSMVFSNISLSFLNGINIVHVLFFFKKVYHGDNMHYNINIPFCYKYSSVNIVPMFVCMEIHYILGIQINKHLY